MSNDELFSTRIFGVVFIVLSFLFAGGLVFMLAEENLYYSLISVFSLLVLFGLGKIVKLPLSDNKTQEVKND